MGKIIPCREFLMLSKAVLKIIFSAKLINELLGVYSCTMLSLRNSTEIGLLHGQMITLSFMLFNEL